jgi:VanZ family protein
MSPNELRQISAVEFWDKAEHFTAFALGAMNLALALRWTTLWPPARVALVAIATISTFGAIDETHQLFTPGRSGGDVFDWTADTLGAAAGTWAILLFYGRSTRARLLAPARD